jgi:hypothetical protein
MGPGRSRSIPMRTTSARQRDCCCCCCCCLVSNVARWAPKASPGVGNTTASWARRLLLLSVQRRGPSAHKALPGVQHHSQLGKATAAAAVYSAMRPDGSHSIARCATSASWARQLLLLLLSIQRCGRMAPAA